MTVMSTSPEPLGQRTRVVVIDPRPLWRAGLAAGLGVELRTSVTAVATTAELAPHAGTTVAVVSRHTDARGEFVRVTIEDAADIAALAEACALSLETSPSVAGSPGGGAAELTRRERAVLAAVGRGLAAAQIGQELGISARTVDHHRRSASAKLGARSTGHAVALAFAADGR